MYFVGIRVKVRIGYIRLVSDTIGLSFALTSLFLKFSAILWAMIGLERNMVFR